MTINDRPRFYARKGRGNDPPPLPVDTLEIEIDIERKIMNPSFPAQFARLSILYRAANLAADQVQAATAALPVNSSLRRDKQDQYSVLLGLLNALQLQIDSMLPSVAAEVLADIQPILDDLRFFVGGTLRRQVNQPVDPEEPVEFVDDGPMLAVMLFLQRSALIGEGKGA